MSYIPTTYSVLDNVTAAKLNKIENAVANATKNFVVLEVISNNALIQTVNTFQEIYNYVSNGKIVFFRLDASQEHSAYVYYQLTMITQEFFGINIKNSFDNYGLYANSANTIATGVIVS